jgi:hypothetical protein
MRMQPCDDILFVESEVWTWKMTDEYSVLAYFTGNIKEAYLACNSVRNLPEFVTFPESEQNRILKNLETFERIYKEQYPSRKKSTEVVES